MIAQDYIARGKLGFMQDQLATAVLCFQDNDLVGVVKILEGIQAFVDAWLLEAKGS